MSYQVQVQAAPPTAIAVENGCKQYGKSGVVLQNLNMAVPTGTIYALLGSSGCGKTTLISCILGLKRFNSGKVQIFGEEANQIDSSLIGYMPQEVGIHDELTISEELQYFGRLYNFSETIIQERTNFLTNLLELPKSNKEIGKCSGGERRRISLAITLLHQPALLILDEPTVGVDPLLREKIWEHLYKLVRDDGVTVLVSTHYTEEARNANVVSFIRSGSLLFEESPQSILDRFNAILLEDVVLRLCKKSDTSSSLGGHHEVVSTTFSSNTLCCTSTFDPEKSEESNNIVEKKWESKEISEFYPQEWNGARPDLCVMCEDKPKKVNVNLARRHVRFELKRSLRIIYAIFVLTMKTFIRHPFMLGFLLTICPSNILMFVTIYSGDPHSTIGYVNHEQTEDCFLPTTSFQKFGCDLLESFQSSDRITLVPFETDEEALLSVKAGQTDGYLVIPSNFSKNLRDRAVFGKFADDETLEGSTVRMHLDLTNYIRNAYLHDSLYSIYMKFVESKLNQTSEAVKKDGLSFPPASSKLKMFKINEKLSNQPDTRWVDVGVASTAIIGTWLVPTVIALVSVWDRKRGVMQRTKVAGGTFPHAALASLLAYSILIMIEVVLEVVAIVSKDIPFRGSYFDFFVVAGMQGVTGLCYGLFIGCICTQELEVVFGILFLYMVSLISAGSLSSLESMAVWVRWIVVSLPFKLSSMALERIILNGWSLCHGQVLLAFLNQGVWIVGCVAVAGWVSIVK